MSVVEHSKAVGGHLADAGRSAFDAGKSALSNANSYRQTADATISKAINDNHGVWGAMKHGATQHPVTASFIAAATAYGVYKVGKGIFGSHTAREAERNANDNGRYR